MIFSQNSLPFRERSGLVRTARSPLPACAPLQNLAMNVPVAPPLPDPAALLVTQGCPPPDRGLTAEWPYGDPTAP